MIIDRIENASRYYALSEGIAEALKWLQTENLNAHTEGSYVIKEGKLRMLVFDSEQINKDRVKLEGHRKNIDVQYWVKGSEQMGYAPLQNEPLLAPFNEEKDYGNFNAEASFTKFDPGMFAIYFPTDLHTAITEESCLTAVRKIVFKVAIEE